MKQKQSISLKLSPTFFPTLLKVLGVVMVWRGIWELLDLYFLPDNPIASYVAGIVVGLFLLYLPDNNIDDLV